MVVLIMQQLDSARSLIALIMTSPPSLMGLPTELRLEIIKHIVAKSQKRAEIPCCIVHCNDAAGWIDGAFDFRGLPAATGDVAVLLRVSRKLCTEVTDEFFANLTARFCINMP